MLKLEDVAKLQSKTFTWINMEVFHIFGHI